MRRPSAERDDLTSRTSEPPSDAAETETGTDPEGYEEDQGWYGPDAPLEDAPAESEPESAEEPEGEVAPVTPEADAAASEDEEPAVRSDFRPVAGERPAVPEEDAEFWAAVDSRVEQILAYREQVGGVADWHYHAFASQRPRFFEQYGASVRRQLNRLPAETRGTEAGMKSAVLMAIAEQAEASGDFWGALERVSRYAQTEEQGSRQVSGPAPPPPARTTPRPPSPSGAPAPAPSRRERESKSAGTDVTSALAGMAGVTDPLLRMGIATEATRRR